MISYLILVCVIGELRENRARLLTLKRLEGARRVRLPHVSLDAPETATVEMNLCLSCLVNVNMSLIARCDV